ncbi:hypothetical protein ACH4UT_23405 [Streptomyces sp. NPDC020799]|uniref:hypothetical protein n=1 Tax=Streptomyces sp. NPDC020799 TaxID=3365091 RepID=UPI00348613A2
MSRPSPTNPPAQAVSRDAHWAAKLARLRARALPERVLTICDDQSARRCLDDAKTHLAACRHADAAAGRSTSDETRRAEDDLAAAQALYDEVAITLRFRALPRPAIDALIRRFPPTETQAEEGDAWNPELFPAALIAAAHVERDEQGKDVDGMSEQDAQDLLDAWPIADANNLFQAAWQVQQVTHASVEEVGKD